MHHHNELVLTALWQVLGELKGEWSEFGSAFLC
jgi:hypothetical protein